MSLDALIISNLIIRMLLVLEIRIKNVQEYQWPALRGNEWILPGRHHPHLPHCFLACVPRTVLGTQGRARYYSDLHLGLASALYNTDFALNSLGGPHHGLFSRLLRNSLHHLPFHLRYLRDRRAHSLHRYSQFSNSGGHPFHYYHSLFLLCHYAVLLPLDHQVLPEEMRVLLPLRNRHSALRRRLHLRAYGAKFNAITRIAARLHLNDSLHCARLATDHLHTFSVQACYQWTSR